MKIVNNLFFDGDCREAFETYARILGGRITSMIRFGDIPSEAKLGEDYKDRVMHAWLEVADQSIMGCDAPPGFDKRRGGFTVAVHLDDATEARRLFEALVEGGHSSMDFAETFWSPGFGMLTDRFGTPWTINTNPATA